MRLTKSGNARRKQLHTHGAYRVAKQQNLACLSGSERQRPEWFLDMNLFNESSAKISENVSTIHGECTEILIQCKVIGGNSGHFDFGR